MRWALLELALTGRVVRLCDATDGRTAIGPEPKERDAYRSWYGARRTIKDARELLTPGAVPARQVVAARGLPSLDIEL